MFHRLSPISSICNSNSYYSFRARLAGVSSETKIYCFRLLVYLILWKCQNLTTPSGKSISLHRVTHSDWRKSIKKAINHFQQLCFLSLAWYASICSISLSLLVYSTEWGKRLGKGQFLFFLLFLVPSLRCQNDADPEEFRLPHCAQATTTAASWASVAEQKGCLMMKHWKT